MSAWNPPTSNFGAAGQPQQVRRAVEQILQSPFFRAEDQPRLTAMAQHLLLCPEDTALAEVFFAQAQAVLQAAAANFDPFQINLPPRGSLVLSANDLLLLNLPNGDSLGQPLLRWTCNVLVAGPTGTGKSTYTRWQVVQLALAGALVIYFDLKNQAQVLLNHPALRGKVAVLRAEDLAFSLYQLLPGQSREQTANFTTDYIARMTGRLFAQRILEELLSELLPKLPTTEGIPLPLLVEALRHYPTRGGWRQADLKESILLALTHLNTHLGRIYSYASSNCSERAVNYTPGAP